MKTKHIVRAQLGADGKLQRLNSGTKSSRTVRGRADIARLGSPGAFAPDDETPILTRRELQEFKPVDIASAPDLGALRRRLRLSQGAFALVFGIPLATVKDWEQGRRRPDAPARAYLRVIAGNPEAVRKALRGTAE